MPFKMWPPIAMVSAINYIILFRLTEHNVVISLTAILGGKSIQYTPSLKDFTAARQWKTNTRQIRLT